MDTDMHKLWTRKDAAQLLGVSQTTFRYYLPGMPGPSTPATVPDGSGYSRRSQVLRCGDRPRQVDGELIKWPGWLASAGP